MNRHCYSRIFTLFAESCRANIIYRQMAVMYRWATWPLEHCSASDAGRAPEIQLHERQCIEKDSEDRPTCAGTIAWLDFTKPLKSAYLRKEWNIAETDALCAEIRDGVVVERSHIPGPSASLVSGI